jgi:hypothetical protein
MATFHYEILEVLEDGLPDIRAFVDHFPPSGSWAIIYPTAEGVCTESISEPYYRLLEQLDGCTPPGQIASRLDIPAEEAVSFLQFAASEGIIVLPR